MQRAIKVFRGVAEIVGLVAALIAIWVWLGPGTAGTVLDRLADDLRGVSADVAAVDRRVQDVQDDTRAIRQAVPTLIEFELITTPPGQHHDAETLAYLYNETGLQIDIVHISMTGALGSWTHADPAELTQVLGMSQQAEVRAPMFLGERVVMCLVTRTQEGQWLRIRRTYENQSAAGSPFQTLPTGQTKEVFATDPGRC